MKTLNLYVIKGVLVILVSSILILTFCMLGGQVMQMLQYLSQGVPFMDFLKMILYICPMMMTYTIPMGILVSVLLLFGRMSSSNEITAMRACGISIFEIITPLILLTFALTLLCVYFQSSLAPVLYGKSKVLIKDIATTHPDALITPGTPADFDNMVVYVKNKEGDKLDDVQIFSFTDNKQKVEQDITASNGRIVVNSEKATMTIILYNYNIISYKDDSRIYGDELEVTINIGKAFDGRPISKQPEFLTVYELMGRISLYNQLGLDTTECEVQLNLRWVMALSPIAFLLLGLPLAIRTSRSETSVGLFISIILAGLYFFFVIGCKSLTSADELHPELLVWVPNIVYQLGGFYFIIRITRR
jgi:lipopolysaccharide export system permease protein